MQTGRNVYVVLTSTKSKFGKVIRTFTGEQYNHLSISLNNDLSDLCTFGRRKYTTPLNAGFIYEKLEYFTLNKYNNINVKVYKIPVTDDQYKKLKNNIASIANDDEYMYNLFSALTYPFIGGFYTYKAYTCVEFVASVLDEVGIVELDRTCSITPNEYGNMLEKYEYYSGNLVNILNKSGNADEFFKNDKIYRAAWTNVRTVSKLTIRLGNKIKQRLIV